MSDGLLTKCIVCDQAFQSDGDEEDPDICPECRSRFDKLDKIGSDLSALDGDEEDAEDEGRDADFYRELRKRAPHQSKIRDWLAKRETKQSAATQVLLARRP
jgi:hypothetical protein